MPNITKLLMIFLILNRLKSVCDKGCLRCTPENTCELCDMMDFYKLVNNACEKVVSENCLLINQSGECVACNQGFYIEKTSRKCIAVDKPIQNCFFYDSTQSCMICNTDFFLDGIDCKPVTNKIANCQFYVLANQCSICQDGYLIDFDSKTCTQVAKNTCVNFSRIKCDKCNSAYIKNENLYFKEIFKFSSLVEKEVVLNLIASEDSEEIKKQTICEKTTVDNCLEFENFKKCKVCKSGYFLIPETGLCQIFPISVIANCMRYSSYTSCIECSNQFFLKNSTSCSPVQEVENCNEYNGTSSTTSCKTCKDEYYLSGSTCKIREKVIDKCDEKSKTSDSCLRCASGFQKTNDSLKCLPVVPDCEVYSSSSISDEALNCTQCKKGFILDVDVCKQGTIAGCAIYTANSSFSSQTCEECNNQFFLNNNTCTQINPISNCLFYNGTKDKTCDECEAGHFNFLINSKCKTLTPITNCRTYTTNSNPLTCDLCNEGYLPNTEKTVCSPMTITNCASGSDLNTCTECKKDFALNGGNCYGVLDFMSKNCQLTDINDRNDGEVLETTCKECKITSIPIEHSGLGVCVKNENLPIFSITAVPNCAKYNINGNCIECNLGKYLLDDGSCSDTCGLTITRYNYTNKKSNYCQGTAGACNITSPKIVGTGNGCIKCSTNHVRTLSYTSNDYTNVVPAVGTDIISNPRELVPIVDCVDQTGKTFNEGTNSSSSTPILNCKYFKARTGNANHLDCIRCNDFYSGAMEGAIITSCNADTDSKEDKKYGLDLIWEKLFSVYECKSSGNIPFIGYIETAANNPTPTILRAINPADAPFNGTLKKSNFCSLNTADANINQNRTILDNCGLAAYRISSSNTVTSVVCAACKPGFKASTVDATYSFIKTACTAIPNCTGTQWFNSCSQCANNFAYEFNTTTNEIDYTSCVSYTFDANCYAVSNTGQCQICKKGFVLNEDLFCDNYTPPNCASNNNFNYATSGPSFTANNPNYKAFMHFRHNNVLGCGACKTGYSIVELSSNLRICTESEYIKTYGSTLGATSNYIKYCESYFYDSDYKCKKCKAGQILVASKDKCVAEITDCLIASDTPNQCNTCKSGYALKNNICVKGNIENCEQYYEDSNNTEVLCASCANNYFLDSNDTKCTKTLVKNCKEPISLKKCDNCEPGFMMYQQSDFDYCFPIDGSYDCNSVSIANNTDHGAEITCNSCSLSNQIIVTDSGDNIPIKTICMPYRSTENCKTHNVYDTLSESTFHCLECKEGYYLNKNDMTCIERKVLPNDCIVYKTDEDICLQCSETTFKEDNGKKCTAFPVGIIGCVNYLNAASCTGCRENMFLSGKTCENVLEANFITNCVLYQNGTTCKECKENFVLNNNTCTKANVNNCIKFVSNDICEICKSGYGLKETAGKTDCVSVNQAKCVTYTPKDPFPCLICEADFYPDTDGKCVKANPLITDCILYKNNETCEKCKTGTILALDKKSCLKGNLAAFIPQFCETSVLSEPLCIICSAGNVFNNGQCTPCAANGAATGCFSCDPFNDNKCIVCQSKYFMNKDGVCTSILPPPEPVDTKFYQKMFVFYAFILFFMMFK
jgi:hypothetical protein